MNAKSFLNLVIISLLMVVFAFFSINFNFQNYNFESRGDIFLNNFTKNINDVTVISIESFDNNIDLIKEDNYLYHQDTIWQGKRLLLLF